MEPLSCVVHALRRLRLAPAARVLIAGPGPIGLPLLQAVRRNGAAQVVVTDLRTSRLELAHQVGAGHTVQAGSEAEQRLPLTGYEAGLAAARAGEGSMKVQSLPWTPETRSR